MRIEDLDAPRCIPGAADDILRTLNAFGLNSDEPILYQSQRTAAYETALQRLKNAGAAYPCCCTRKEIADSALHGIEGPVYPGTCRSGVPPGKEARAWRVRTDALALEFEDALQGRLVQNLETEIGDFVVKRTDGLFAYQLAVVIDDALQGITHVMRGADLLASTPRQIHLQRLLGLPTPAYLHLPVAIDAAGEKLGKQTLAAPVDARTVPATLWRALEFLRQQPPADLSAERPERILEWAIAHWERDRLRGLARLAV